VRIRSEHTIGYLKGRFSSLRGLRQQINSKRDHEIAINWIITCVILHNIILDIEGGIDEDDEFSRELLEEGLDGGDGTPADSLDGYSAVGTRPDSNGAFKRNQLRQALVDYLED
jgi:hypothetical protein